ncbi:MAG: GntR family transcriptional regulator [Syntrophomonas sp.]|uniref:GntR family transcriptional regulator n=1 Tax=Syntrophomonas sp. TaxID=2053627 RepID=UPI00260BB1D5|nr:GntR family transcriptional regulator [Syntrophomonas sp.]MDD2510483.1 GntR family transcriptional regulator [Syntrophomonas sp.]MDD3880174.1 GntR family transcriptional regulator [Syntrophomonas sp.]MDD4627007.1 GntR family transcriptional regulator [Syntrophomonas sp.]
MNIVISNRSEEPIYHQIYQQLRGAIVREELKAGEPLPSIRSLARDLQVSVITTRRAYDDLERDGYIETVAGKGSFVAPQNAELLREKRVNLVEEKLGAIIQEARSLGLSLPELQRIVELLYEEGL